MALAAALALLVISLSASTRNAAADSVVQQSLTFGIDFDEKDKRAPHPAADDARALSRAGAGSWLGAQLQDDSDEISEPPAALREFLEERHEALWSLISALEKAVPEWGPDADAEGNVAFPLLPVVRLERVLIAAALVEERDGNRIDSGRALEAAWSLGRSLELRNVLIAQMLAISIENMQVGAVRKMHTPPLQWLGRLGSDGPWPRMLDAVADAPKFGAGKRDDPGHEIAVKGHEIAVKGVEAIADALRKRSPCDLAGMSAQDVWQPAAAALAAETDALKRALRDLYADTFENIGNCLRRAARLEVDRELSLRIVEIRLEKDASRDGRWPEKVDAASAVCPGASYDYLAGESGVALRFEGPIDVPAAGLILPLVFRSRLLQTTPTPAPRLTPTPEGGMIPPQ